jgi:hypothetical protein
MNLLELIESYRHTRKHEGVRAADRWLAAVGVHPAVRKAIQEIDEGRLCACGQLYETDAQNTECTHRERVRAAGK